MREEWNFMFDNKVFMLPWNNIIKWYRLNLLKFLVFKKNLLIIFYLFF